MSERNWSKFATNACSACIEKNGNETKFFYVFDYEPEEITITYSELIDGLLYALQCVSLDKETYEEGNRSDEEILESLFNTIQSNRGIPDDEWRELL